MDIFAKNLANKIPELKPIMLHIQETRRWLRLRSLMRSLHPISTDKTLLRFGSRYDGGYLIPDDLEGIHACFSPGIGRVSGFEKDCANRGMNVFLADASVDAPVEQHERFHFSKVFIGRAPKENYISLNDWVTCSLNGDSGDLLLQMDIEGSEYEVINDTSTELFQRFRIIVIEFHGIPWLNKDKINAFKKLLKTHSCVHIHPNNRWGAVQLRGLILPRIMEFTFLRHDRIAKSEFRKNFPHPLDVDNTSKPTLLLPKCWYRNTCNFGERLTGLLRGETFKKC